MSYLKEIYEILQLHVCLNFMEITVFFRGGGGCCCLVTPLTKSIQLCEALFAAVL